MNATLDPKSLDAVIFDFGGVILNLDYPATDKALRALLGEEGEIRYTKAHQSRVFDDFEIGAITPEAFYASLQSAATRAISEDEIRAAWNAMLLDAPLARFDFVRAIAARYRTFLFSNTNAIHKAAFDQTLALALGGEGRFDKLFERAYYSHEFRMRKPHAATYRALLDENGLRPERTLMIDDNLDNIRGAREAGLQVYHLTGELLEAKELTDLLR